MKSLFKKSIYLTGILIIFVLVQCKKDNEKDVKPLQVTSLIAPIDKISLPLKDNGTMTFEWEASRNGATYKVVFDNNGGDFSNPIFEIVAADNGKKASLVIAHARLDDIAKNLGIKKGTAGSFKWTIVATDGGESAKSLNEHQITVERFEDGEDCASCLPCEDCEPCEDDCATPLAVPYLYSPINGASISLQADGLPLYFSWEASVMPNVTYKVVFDNVDGNFSNPYFSDNSDNEGISTRLILTQAQLDKLLETKGLKDDEPFTFKWTVIAYLDGKSAIADKVHTVTIKRISEISQLYITGAATETGDNIADALVMKMTEPGKFEIFTKLSSGLPFKFVDKTSGKSFYTNNGAIIAGEGADAVGKTAVYRINIDFNEETVVLREIEKVCLYLNMSQELVELPYTGKGVWTLTEHFIGDIFVDADNEDSRYKFRMIYAGNLPETKEWRRPTESPDLRPNEWGAIQGAAYYYMEEKEELTQWTHNSVWKNPASTWNQNMYNVEFILQGDKPYTHSFNARFYVDYDWVAIADRVTGVLYSGFFNTGTSYRYFTRSYNQSGLAILLNPPGYWPQAHALDAVLDAYTRNGNTGINYIEFFGHWAAGVPSYNSNRWTNSYIDDMQWIALATSRANKALIDKQQPIIAGFTTSYTHIWNGTSTTPNQTNGTNGVRGAWSNKAGQMVGITDPAGAGMFWNAGTVNGNNSRQSKNACANSPGSILAAYLYQWFDIDFTDDLLLWATTVYDWTKATLFDASTGAIWDNVHYRSSQEGTFNRTVFSYNNGTFIGAAVELYNITGNAAYITDAVRAADYILRNWITTEGYLRPGATSGQGGDGALFHGIFCRYLTNLILCDGLDEINRRRYVDFLLLNGWYLWNEGLEGGNKTPLLIVAEWGKPNNFTTTTLNEHVCGATLFECLARLQIAGKL